ncbi:hypothetical protein POM88_030443 [Heracleum sosnowskyi]|uniref:Uncharacterized protein n=1 Tax=Heracleum sosnowskyi TaxID=360622 RepID=A0AAD8MFS0_9APIA|nr:hypothetical protein POM88_030443 [Heracleum sosnowskyi]
MYTIVCTAQWRHVAGTGSGRHGGRHIYCFRNRSRPSESVASDHDMDVASDHDMARSNDPTRSGNAQNNTWVQKAEGADNYLVSSDQDVNSSKDFDKEIGSSQQHSSKEIQVNYKMTSAEENKGVTQLLIDGGQASETLKAKSDVILGAQNHYLTNLLANFQRELRGICGNIGQVEAPTTCLKCKSGVEHHYCTRNHSRPSKFLAGHDMDQVKTQNIIPAGSFPLRYVEQLHPTRSGNTWNDVSVQKAKGADNYFSLFRLFSI